MVVFTADRLQVSVAGGFSDGADDLFGRVSLLLHGRFLSSVGWEPLPQLGSVAGASIKKLRLRKVQGFLGTEGKIRTLIFDRETVVRQGHFLTIERDLGRKHPMKH